MTFSIHGAAWLHLAYQLVFGRPADRVGAEVGVAGQQRRDDAGLLDGDAGGVVEASGPLAARRNARVRETICSSRLASRHGWPPTLRCGSQFPLPIFSEN